MKRIFLTFADSSMSRALKRINGQAVQMDVYNQIVIANEFNLDLRFREKYKKNLISGTRGFGYWIWKAQLIAQTLLQMDEGDILHYADAGCHLNPGGRKRLLEYFALAESSKMGILGFQAFAPSFHNPKIILPDLSEYKWCKGDLCDYFGVRSNNAIMRTQTIGAGIIFIKKCQRSVEFIKDWLSVYESGIQLVDDTPSISKNLDGFIEHRHDQSIFSILAKLNKIDVVSAYEYWYPWSIMPLLPDWAILKNYPIHARRDKGVHWLKKPYALLMRVYRRIRFELKKSGL